MQQVWLQPLRNRSYEFRGLLIGQDVALLDSALLTRRLQRTIDGMGSCPVLVHLSPRLHKHVQVTPGLAEFHLFLFENFGNIRSAQRKFDIKV